MRLYKRRLWLSAVGVFLVVGIADFILDRRHLPSHFFASGLLVAFYLFFLRRNTRFHLLADEVIDCGDHLQVLKGRIRAVVPFSTIAGASFSPGPSLMSKVIVESIQPMAMGKQIEFLTEQQSRTDFTEARAIAEDLNARAMIARTATVI